MRHSGCTATLAATVEVLEGRVLLSAAHDARVYDQGSVVRGKTLGEWAAAWTQWALAIPPAQNPIIDPTGASAGVNQPKDVFFLAGTFGGDATRDVTIPTGTPVYFPVINDFWINVDKAVPPDYPVADPPFAQNEANIRADFNAHVSAYTGLFATVDGRPVSGLSDHVEEDPAGGFQINFPADNITGLPPDALGRAAVKGVFLMLQPLSQGEHTIHFGGADPLFGFALDVTYNVDVVPKGQYRKAADNPATTVFSSKPVVEGKKRLADEVLAL